MTAGVDLVEHIHVFMRHFHLLILLVVHLLWNFSLLHTCPNLVSSRIYIGHQYIKYGSHIICFDYLRLSKLLPLVLEGHYPSDHLGKLGKAVLLHEHALLGVCLDSIKVGDSGTASTHEHLVCLRIRVSIWDIDTLSYR